MLILEQVFKFKEMCKEESKKVCCNDCDNFGHDSACASQPYPEFYCIKGHWDMISNTDDLYRLIDCSDFKPIKK